MKGIRSRRSGVKRRSAFAAWLMAICAALLAGAPVLAQEPPAGTGDRLPGAAEADAESGAIVIGQTVYGAVDDNSDADVFQFRGLAGESVRVHVRATSGDLEPVVTLFLGPVPWTAPATAAAMAAAGAGMPQSQFNRGDVFVSVGQGKVKRFRPDGTLVQTLDTGVQSEQVGGMAFDAWGNLYVAAFHGDTIIKFDSFGRLVGPFGSGFDRRPESIVVDRFGQFYVGQSYGGRKVLKFDSLGNLIDSYSPATERTGTDQIDLASDQRTLYYTSEGPNVLRYDLATRTQLTPFNQQPLGSDGYTLRILPDGGVLVATAPMIVRLDASGQVVQVYDAPGEDMWFTLNLDPDRETFWSANYSTGQVYRFELDSGRVVTDWSAGVLTVLGGVVI